MTIAFEHLSYSYPPGPSGQPQQALDDISATIAEGSFTLLAGASAGGKSTLLRTINGLVPQFHGGRMRGVISVAGLDPSRTPARRMARLVGMVFQEPEAQAVADSVEDEFAFGMEQHGIPRPEMRRRVEALLPELGIEPLRYRSLNTLSGGERQRVAIAAVLALEPSILLLDEPTSQIDPTGADAVIAALRRLRELRGLTVVVAEHRLERLLPIVDTVFEVEAGRATAMSPREAAAVLRTVPPVCAIGRRLGWAPLPLTVAEAGRFPATLCPGVGATASRTPASGPPLLEVEHLTVAYGEQLALANASFTIHGGEVIALVGANGSGKSTLFRAIAGLVQPVEGRILFDDAPAATRVQDRTAHAGLVPQDPAIALYHETVRAEIAETLRYRRSAASSLGLEHALEAWDLPSLAASNPRDLSVGQQQRVAIATMLAHEPPVWLLDEPTRGADGPARAWLAARLLAHAADGGAAIVATHDIESAARYATRVIGLDRGQIAFDLPAAAAFAANGSCPTQAARLLLGAILPEDVV